LRYALFRSTQQLSEAKYRKVFSLSLHLDIQIKQLITRDIIKHYNFCQGFFFYLNKGAHGKVCTLLMANNPLTAKKQINFWSITVPC